MEIRLNDLVIAGAIFNTSTHSVHGQLQLRGAEMPVLFELTGAPCEELRGRHFEFEIPGNERPATEEDRARVQRMANQQIGPCRLTKSAGPGGAARICLEWFGQNGRAVLDLDAAQVRFITLESAASADDDEDEHGEGEGEEAGDFEADEIPDFPPAMEDDEDEEGYGLIPEELNRELERSARRTDLEIAGESEDVLQSMDECERMDDLIENGEGTPIRALIAKLHLPDPDEISGDAEAAEALTRALAELALFGVAFHICEHFTVRAAYRMFIETAGDSKVFPEMRGTSWVQHFSTSDSCPDCLGDPQF